MNKRFWRVVCWLIGHTMVKYDGIGCFRCDHGWDDPHFADGDDIGD